MSAEKAGTLRFSRPADWRYGFTLAETLIALVIIGIIAAITVPNLIEDYQKRQTISGLKKAYSDLQQAVAYAKNEHGDLSNWDFSLSGYDFFNTYMRKYYNVLSETTKGAAGLTFKRTCGSVENTILQSKSNAKILGLSNGMLIIMTPDIYGSKTRKTITVDINGYKKPNQFGKDIFFFSVIDGKEQVRPNVFVDKTTDNNIIRTREQLKNGIGASYDNQCNKNSRGIWCAALIMADGWQISDDYPW